MQPPLVIITADVLAELDYVREPLSFLPSHSSCNEHFSCVIPLCKLVRRHCTTGLLYHNLFYLPLIVGHSGGFQFVPIVETRDRMSLCGKLGSPARRHNQSAVEGSVIRERLGGRVSRARLSPL